MVLATVVILATSSFFAAFTLGSGKEGRDLDGDPALFNHSEAGWPAGNLRVADGKYSPFMAGIMAGMGYSDTTQSFMESSSDLMSKAENLCSKMFWFTLNTCVQMYDDDTTFVRTGDIPQMWIRDSAAQLHPYIPLAHNSAQFQRLLEGALRRQAKYIAIDPYANSYNEEWEPTILEEMIRGGYIGETKFELDSGAYFLRFLKTYSETVPTSQLLKERQMYEAVKNLMSAYHLEQNHSNSQYSIPRGAPWWHQLPGGPRGQPVGYTGMVWSGFRPSDDAHIYGYNIPGNLFLASYLPFVVKTARNVWGDGQLAESAQKLQNDILDGVEKFGVKEIDGKKLYCYETDGLGNCNLMDDANVPSLLSIPYLDPSGKYYNREVYKNTRSFILSQQNPWYFEGTAAKGIGSPHTGQNRIWPMSLIIEAFTTDSPQRRAELIKIIVDTSDNGSIHESFYMNDHRAITREWFAWPNALFAELVQSTGASCGSLENVPKMPKILPQSRTGPLSQMSSATTFYTADTKTLRYRSIPGLNLVKAQPVSRDEKLKPIRRHTNSKIHYKVRDQGGQTKEKKHGSAPDRSLSPDVHRQKVLPVTKGGADSNEEKAPQLVNLEKMVHAQMNREHNTLMVVEVNSGFHLMLQNWLLHIKRANINYYLIVALDQEECNLLHSIGEPVWCTTEAFASEAQGFRTPLYNKIVANKWQIVLDILRTGVNVLLSDVDVIWFQNPIADLMSASSCGMLASSNIQGINAKQTWMNTKFEERRLLVNTGVVYFQSTTDTLKMVSAFVSYMSTSKGEDDQDKFFGFRDSLRKQSDFSEIVADTNQCHIEKTTNLKLTYQPLPRHKYMDFKHWENPGFKSQRPTAIALHYCWLDGRDAKIEHMRQQGHFIVGNQS